MKRAVYVILLSWFVGLPVVLVVVLLCVGWGVPESLTNIVSAGIAVASTLLAFRLVEAK